MVTYIFFKKKKEKTSVKLKEKEEAEDMFFSLCMEKNPLSFFLELYFDKQELKKHKTFLSYIEGNKKIIIAPIFNFLTLSPNDIAQIIKQARIENPKKIIIVAGEISKECHNFINIYDEEIILLDKYETYNNIYKEKKVFPKITILKKQKKKPSFKELLRFSFNRDRCKGYIISSFVLLFCSLFVRATLYYTIVTSMLIMFAIVSFFNPFEQKKFKKE